MTVQTREVESETPTRTGSKTDARIWIGLVVLLLGFASLDRTFSWWRDDGRNFPSSLDGRYYPPDPGSKPPDWWANHTLKLVTGTTGTVLVLISIFLLETGEARSNEESA
jgi:hypothetical protein